MSTKSIAPPHISSATLVVARTVDMNLREIERFIAVKIIFAAP
jgi:hypothetical protein